MCRGKRGQGGTRGEVGGEREEVGEEREGGGKGMTKARDIGREGKREGKGKQREEGKRRETESSVNGMGEREGIEIVFQHTILHTISSHL